MTSDTKEHVGWAKRFLIAACEKLLRWILNHELGASPHDSMMFLSYCGFGWNEAHMAQSLTRLKMDQGG